MYLPADRVQFADLADVATSGAPAFFRDHHHNMTFLVAGSYALFLQDHIGDGLQLGPRGEWTGLVIDNVEVEVDVSSFTVQRPSGPLPMKRKGDGLFLQFADNQSGFSQSREVAVLRGLSAVDQGLYGYFTRWRLFIVVRDDPIILYTHDANPPQSRMRLQD